MGIYYFAYALVLAACVVPLLIEQKWRKVLIVFGFSSIILFLSLMAGMRSPSVDHDYSNYLSWYAQIEANPPTLYDFAKDPAFGAISKSVAWVGGTYVLVAWIYGALALSMTWVVGSSANKLWLFPFFMYLDFCRYYLVQDMTAIRAAVAIPIVTLSLLAAYRKHRCIACILFVIALMFHASAVLVIPALLIAMFGEVKSRRIFIYLMVAAVISFVAFRNLITYLSNIARLADYFNGTYDVSQLRLFSVYFCFRLFVVVFIVSILWKKISSEDRFVIFCTTLGLTFQIVLASNDTLALRSSEVFGIFDVLMFLIPLKILRNETQLAYAIVLLLSGAIFFNSSTKVMNHYRTVLSSTSIEESGDVSLCLPDRIAGVSCFGSCDDYLIEPSS
jgi:hypothetical protein